MSERRKAVIGGVLQYTSASAIQKHRRCPRQWYFRYVQGLPDKPPSAGVIRGLEGHARLEHYFKTGQNTLDPLEQMALKYLPPPGQGTVAETEFEMDTGYGFPVVGKIDLIHENRVIDYKFKGSIDKYGSNAADFVDPATDDGVQMLTYAVSGEAAGTELSLEHIDLQWRGRREVAHKAVEVGAHNARVLWHNGVRPELPKMMETARASSALKVFGNEKTCSDYGGCAYLNECFDPITRLRASIRELNARPGEEMKTMGLLGKKSMNPNAVQSAEEAVIDLMPDQPETPRPEEALVDSADTSAVGPEMAVESDPPSAAGVAPAAETTEAPPLKKKKRGRPREAALEPAAEGTSIDEVYLYIGCYPVNQQVTPLLLLVQGLNDRIIEAARLGKQMTDLRAASDAALGYQKWKGYLSDLARHDIIEGRIPPGHYIMLGDDDERVTVVATELAARLPAGHVVRGTR